jgi:hypothetical protein
VTVFAAAVIATTVMAADKPNFSGNWRINMAKSDFGPAPSGAVIHHSCDAL